MQKATSTTLSFSVSHYLWNTAPYSEGDSFRNAGPIKAKYCFSDPKLVHFLTRALGGTRQDEDPFSAATSIHPIMEMSDFFPDSCAELVKLLHYVTLDLKKRTHHLHEVNPIECFRQPQFPEYKTLCSQFFQRRDPTVGGIAPVTQENPPQ
jgi:hypothetical protein